MRNLYRPIKAKTPPADHAHANGHATIEEEESSDDENGDINDCAPGDLERGVDGSSESALVCPGQETVGTLQGRRGREVFVWVGGWGGRMLAISSWPAC